MNRHSSGIIKNKVQLFNEFDNTSKEKIASIIQNRFEDYAFEGLELLNICAKHVDNELID